MNKLITTNNGGMPDDLNDFRFYESAVEETIKNIVRGMNLGDDTGLRLWGAEVVSNGANYDISEGAIFLDGVLYKVPAHSLVKLTGSGTYFWGVDESYDINGTEVFQNGETVATYQVRVAKLKKTTTLLSLGSYVALDCPRLSDLWQKVNESGAWTEITPPVTAVTGQAFFRIRENSVEFRGYWVTDGGSGTHYYTLPAEARPSGVRRFYCLRANTGGSNTPTFEELSDLFISYNAANGQLGIPMSKDLIVNFNDIPPLPLIGS